MKKEIGKQQNYQLCPCTYILILNNQVVEFTEVAFLISIYTVSNSTLIVQVIFDLLIALTYITCYNIVISYPLTQFPPLIPQLLFHILANCLFMRPYLINSAIFHPYFLAKSPQHRRGSVPLSVVK